MAWWWFATDSLSGASSGPGWNLSFLVCLWKNWSNNESGIFLGVATLFFFISPCLWGAFFGSTLRPVNGSMSSHCWGLKTNKCYFDCWIELCVGNLLSFDIHTISIRTLQNDVFFHNHNLETFWSICKQVFQIDYHNIPFPN